MYPGTAINKNTAGSKAVSLHFKENEDDKNPIAEALRIPAVNITETLYEYRVIVAASGFLREDFCIEIEESIITIAARKEVETMDIINDRCEYNYSDWTRAFTLPEDADAMMAHATYECGELIIRIPRGISSASQEKMTVYVY